MAFTAPKNQAFRRFVALDGDAILSSLSALDGGAVDEILTRRTNDSGGEIGAELAAGPLKGKAAKNKGSKVEEELRKVRTQHSAASALIDGLKKRDALGVLEGVFDDDAASQLTPGTVVEIHGKMSLHPLFQIETLMTNFIATGSKFGAAKEAREAKEFMPFFQVLMGNHNGKGRVLVDIDTGEGQCGRLVAFVDRSMLEIPMEDLNGMFTTVAQVDGILGTGDPETMVMRVMRGAPPSEHEKNAITEGMDGLIEAADGLGVSLNQDDLFIRPSSVVLRPLCVWR